MRNLFRFLSLALVSAYTVQSMASGFVDNLEAEVGLEARYFVEEGLAGQQNFHPSIRLEAGYSQEWDNDSVELVLFGRWDQEDSERTHFDVREAAWTHVGDSWELKAGISKVFWGVTESRHLVDVINQTDNVENVDGEDKLGQPMVKLSTEREWGTVDLFWLPYFRERTFSGEDGRFVTAVPNPFVSNSLIVTPVDTSEAVYESGAEEKRSDFAIRYSHYIGDLEFALSHFSGTSRAPVPIFNGNFADPRLNPYYAVIDQTGVELQYIYEDWLLKLEGITSSGPIDRYSAAVFGFEFTQYGIWDSQADLGWILEYLFDDSKEEALFHSFERDVFAGWRYALNDEDSSEVIAGFIYDPQSEEIFYSFEANKRLASDLKLNIEARVFGGSDPSEVDDKSAFLQDEDMIQLELVKYF